MSAERRAARRLPQWWAALVRLPGMYPVATLLAPIFPVPVEAAAAE